MRPVLAALSAFVALTSGVVALPAVAEPAAPPALSKYNPVTPARVLDTRTGVGAPVDRIGADATVTLDLSDRLPATATAVVLTVTGVAASSSTTVAAYRAGAPRPATAAVSLDPGEP
ncbi:MAG: hypothetical protein HOV94_23975, partial [Saccharothrix sp.]|nr:hypothetical protein [Saccharothrix sp.]